MKRKWVLKENKDSDDFFMLALMPYVYKCKICERQCRKLRDIKYHISEKHNKWTKRSTVESRNFYNYYFEGRKPETEAISLKILEEVIING